MSAYYPNPLPRPTVSPEEALKSYVTGRWVLFILLGALPALLLSGIPGATSVISLLLLAGPAYLVFLGMKEFQARAHLTRDAKPTVLWLEMGAIALSAFVNFGLSGTLGGEYSNASLFTLGTIILATAYGINSLEVSAQVNPSAVDKKTRTAASAAALITGTLAMIAITAVIVTMLAVTVGIALLFLLGGEPEIMLALLCGLPLVTGVVTLIFGLKGRRNRLKVLRENPGLPNPVFHKKETILLSIAGSSFFLSVALFFVLFLTAYQTSTLLNQY